MADNKPLIFAAGGGEIAAAMARHIEHRCRGHGARRRGGGRHDAIEPAEGRDLPPTLRGVGQERDQRVGEPLRRAIRAAGIPEYRSRRAPDWRGSRCAASLEIPCSAEPALQTAAASRRRQSGRRPTPARASPCRMRQARRAPCERPPTLPQARPQCAASPPSRQPRRAPAFRGGAWSATPPRSVRRGRQSAQSHRRKCR